LSLDELRQKIDLPALIARKVRLTRRGRNHVGLCPFHQEKTPSFSVQEDKGFYHCFGCGAHGDAFTFVMETESLGFREAVERLAEEAGMPSPLKQGRSVKDERNESGHTLYDVMELAASYFETQLKGALGSPARDYLLSRKLGAAAAQKFRLGFAPDSRTGLTDHLTQKGVALDEILALGLALQPEDGRGAYDRFRGRLMFPILDSRGRTIAFGGRTLIPDGKPKYLNSPETPLFKKGAVLFNHQQARAAAAKGATAVVAEGYVDVIALVMAGFEGAVAPLGTALTEEQLALLWRMADEPVLCFDGDKAGQAAAFRAIDRALPVLIPGKALRFAMLPEGQDPDDLIRSQGPAAMEGIIGAARPMVEVIWERELAAIDPSTPERLAGLRARLRAVSAEIGDGDLRRDYAEALNDRLKKIVALRREGGPRNGAGFAMGGGSLGFGAFRFGQKIPVNSKFGREGRIGRGAGTPQPVAEVRATPAAAASLKFGGSALARREQGLMLALISHPELIEPHLNIVENLRLSQPSLDKIRQELLHAAALGNPLDRQGIRDHLTQCGLGDFVVQMERRTILGMPSTKADAPADLVVRDWLHAVNRHQKLQLEAELNEAANALKGEPDHAALQRMQELESEVKSIAGREAGPPDRL
jgi:DNA primase